MKHSLCTHYALTHTHTHTHTHTCVLLIVAKAGFTWTAALRPEAGPMLADPLTVFAPLLLAGGAPPPNRYTEVPVAERGLLLRGSWVRSLRCSCRGLRCWLCSLVSGTLTLTRVSSDATLLLCTCFSRSPSLLWPVLCCRLCVVDDADQVPDVRGELFCTLVPRGECLREAEEETAFMVERCGLDCDLESASGGTSMSAGRRDGCLLLLLLLCVGLFVEVVIWSALSSLDRLGRGGDLPA
jgi:hypothetical protein